MRFSIAATTLLALPALAAPAQDNYGKEKTVTVTITQCPKTTSQAGYPTTSKSVSQSTPKSSAQSSSIPTASASTTASSSSVTGEYPTATATSTWTGKGLQELAKKAGKVYLGTAADIPGTAEENDPYYLQQLGNARDFGQITPANMMKPFATEPERNVFNYTGGQVVIDFAHSHGQINRCHTLVWHNQLPGWLTSQTWDNSTLISIMTNHITQIVKHWGKSCYAWDVVNEAFNDDGTLRSSIWSDTIGPEFLPIAFKAAAAAAPKEVKLYYNDYNIESPGAKSTAAQNLIKDLKARGIRIDGAGLQSHFVIGKTPNQADQESNMAAFAALGVDVAITELDVRAETLPVSLEAQAQQKKDFYSSVKACVNTKRCVGVTLWDFVDQYSWIPYTFAGQGYGTPWLKVLSGKLVKKIAYDGIAEALSGK